MMKRKSVTFLIALLLILLAASPVSAASNYMYLSAAEGEYTVTDASGKTADLAKNPRLKSGCTVKTGEASYVWITLDSAKTCKLDENTALTILRTDRSLTLIVSEGSIVFNVTEKLSAGETMEIRTPAMITEVRGTSGEICASPEGASAAIFDGTVMAYAVCDGERYGEAIPVSAGYVLRAQSADSLNAAAMSDLTTVSDGLKEAAAQEGNSAAVVPMASALGEVEAIDVSKLTDSTLIEITAVAAYADRMDERLMSDVNAVRWEEISKPKHHYPDSAARSYLWSSDKQFCTAGVTCADCGQPLVEIQTAVHVSGRAATCTTAGNRKYLARFKNAAFSDQYVVKSEKPLGHDWKETFSWSGDYSTCNVHCVCARDGSHVESGPAMVICTTLSRPTCWGAGRAIYTAKAVFDTDMHTDYKEVMLPALGHIWDPPTYEWTGDCSECLAFTECSREDCPLRMAETFFSNVSLRGATCTEGGSGTVTATFKNEMFAPQTVSYEGIAPLGHDFGAPVFTWTGVETVTARSVCARDPEHVSERDCEISCEVLTPATCAAEGLARYTASVTFEQGSAQVTYTDTKEAPIPATEVHTPGEPVFSASKKPYTPPASEDAFGVIDPSEETDPTDPSLEEWSGTGTVRCKVCDKVLETETVAGSFDMKIYFHFTSSTFGERVYDPDTGSWSQR